MSTRDLGDATAVPSAAAPRGAWTPPIVLLVAVVLLACAVIATLRGAPAALLAPLWLAAASTVAARVATRCRTGGLDRWLIAVGGTVATLVLLGLVLNLTSIGLRPAGWALGSGLLGLVALTATGRRAAPVSVPWGALLRAAPWGLAAAVVAAVALHTSVVTTDRTEVTPAQLSFGRVEGPKVQVHVSSDRPVGPLELRTTAADGDTVSYPLFSVRRDHPVSTTVLLPATGRFTVSLYYPNQSEPLRSLTLDR